MCPHTTIYQTYRILPYICVLILLYICVLILLSFSYYYIYICPHATVYLSSYYYICVLILLCMSSYYCKCVLILLCMNLQLYLSSSSYSYMCLHTPMCPRTTIFVSSYSYTCPHTTIYVSLCYHVCVLILLYMRQWGRRLLQARAGVDSICFSLPFCSQGSFGSVVCGQMYSSTRHICSRYTGALRYMYVRQISQICVWQTHMTNM